MLYHIQVFAVALETHITSLLMERTIHFKETVPMFLSKRSIQNTALASLSTMSFATLKMVSPVLNH